MARRRSSLLGRLLAGLLLLALLAGAFLALGGVDRVRRIWYPLRYEDLIAAQARANALDPYLVASLINVESGFDAGVTSRAGAVGLMQVKPSTAAAVARVAGVRGATDAAALAVPETNVRIGTRYLRGLLDHYGGDVERALAAYNAGMGNADRWAAEARRAGRSFADSIAFPATARYVRDVMAGRITYQVLYPTVFPAAPRLP